MAPKSVQQTLGELEFFQGLGAEHLAVIAECARREDLGAQQRLVRRNTPADAFYVVLDGKIGVELPTPSGPPLQAQSLGPGSVVGWSWLIPPYKWHMDARAVEHTSMLAVDGKRLLARCDADPALGYALMKRFARLMGERLRAVVEREG
jgi:CRP/FNR family cyclic AMP-dependent transcriptional regulator